MPLTVRHKKTRPTTTGSSSSSSSTKANNKSASLATGQAGGLPLGKQLAHTEKDIRDQAIENLTAFLSSGGALHADLTSDQPAESGTATANNGNGTSSLIDSAGPARKGKGRLLPELEMRRLWKGLFFCFWMSDKALVQQRLASDLSEIVLAIDPSGRGEEGEVDRLDAALDFVAGFWEALVREWNGIDRLRIDKYYMLIRRWQSATFRLLARHDWSPYAVGRFNNVLLHLGRQEGGGGGPFDPTNIRVPLSIAWHLSDIWLDELDKVAQLEAENQEAGQGRIPVVDLLQPFIVCAARAPNPLTLQRFFEGVFRPLVDACNAHTAAVASASRSTKGGEPSAKRRKTTTTTATSMQADDDDDDDDDVDTSGVLAYTALITQSTSSSAESLRASLVRRLFEEASKSSEGAGAVKEANRRKIYAFVRESGGFEEEEEEDVE